MEGYKTKDILASDFIMPTDYEGLKAVYRTLAKSADQRLVRLEKYEHEEYYKTATKWAYARAMNDIHHYSGEMANRFNTAPPKIKETLLAKIVDIKSFLESPTSTKSGITKVYVQRAKTLNKKYGTNFTWESLAKYWESGTGAKLDKKFGSTTSLKAIAEIQRMDDEAIDDIRKSDDKIKMVPDSQLDRVIEDLLRSNDIDIEEIRK